MAFPTDPIYKLIKDSETDKDTIAIRWDNYQFVIGGKHRFATEYQEWLDAGNTPEAAD
tara:strand:- start:18 stop:191 length:174 start_codon:yes stop_codon:yes gene_type:complete